MYYFMDRVLSSYYFRTLEIVLGGMGWDVMGLWLVNSE